jgi:predicted type IV restriction endonuclease
MDLIDQLRALAAQIPKQVVHLQTEEATKNALVMPFINALGYNVFDPTEVVPEFTADVGIKKGEKIDYAIFKDGKPIMLFECKWSGADLSKEHASQLHRYFHVTESRFAVLTNGILYRFYTDLEEPNKMDSKPFLELNMLDIKESLIDEIKYFTKSTFNLDTLLTAASELKYTKEIKRILLEELTSPSDEFIKCFTKKAYPGTVTQSIRSQFAEVTKRAFQQLVSDQISDRLRAALGEEKTPALVQQSQANEKASILDEPLSTELSIVTTQEEIEGYYIVKAILCEIIDSSRIYMRDVQSYCGILLDDNNRKPICRLHFNFSKKYIGFFDENKIEEKVHIERVDDIFKYAERLKTSVGFYKQLQASASE